MQSLRIIANRLHTFHKRTANLLLLVLLPLVLVFGHHQFGAAPNDAARRLPIAVIDQDQTALSRLIISRLRENERLHIKHVDDAQVALLRLEIDAAFTIRDGFASRVAEGDIAGMVALHYIADNVTVQIPMEIVAQEFMRVFIDELGLRHIRQLYAAHGFEFSDDMAVEAQQFIDSFWAQGLTVPITFQTAASPTTAAADNRAMIIGSLMGGAALLMLFFLAAEPVRQKEEGVFKRLRLHGLSPKRYGLLLACTDVLPFMLILPLVLPQEWLLYTLLFLYAAMMNAFFIRFVRSMLQLLFVSLIWVVPTAFLGGIAFYFSGVWPLLSAVLWANPVYWLIHGYNNMTQALPALAAGMCAMLAVYILLPSATTKAAAV